jgi:hypothetical protein
MVKLNLLFITVSISVHSPKRPRLTQSHEDRIRIQQLLEENERKRYFHHL